MAAIDPHDYYAGRMLQGLIAAGLPIREDTVDDLADRAHRLAGACVARRTVAIREVDAGADCTKVHALDLYASEALIGLVQAESDRGLSQRQDLHLVRHALLLGKVMVAKRQELRQHAAKPAPVVQSAL
jgi:hypothetical protein